ncbi:MAG: hypothetical protein WCA26_21410 [Xanthobacteraceae bacterium]
MAGNAGRFRKFRNIWGNGGISPGESFMNRRDQELLEKQLHSIYVAPRSDGVLMLGVLAVFFAGIALGGFLYAYTGEPLRLAANDTAAAISSPQGAPLGGKFE